MLVTGGSGFLGSELLRRAPGAVGTWLSKPIDGGVQLDVRDAAAVERAVAGHDVVIHTAYVQEESDTIAAGSANVAAACAAAGARLIHLSTDVVFDGKLGRPYTENDEPNPITDYGRAKRDAERFVAERCPRALIIRTSLLYAGPPHEPSRQEREPLDAVAGRVGAKAFFTDEWRSPVQVGDLASALLELVDERPQLSGVLHVGGADSVSRYEFARLMVGARGRNPDAINGASFKELGMDRPADCTLDSTRARAILKTRLRGVREVLG